MPAFLTAKNLKPFISKELEVTSSQVEFKPLKGARAFGYPAELLPSVCGVFLDADEASALTAMQKHVATRARILIRGLAHVGVTALVDEATGYQEVRDRYALQAILDQYLKKELAAWAKRFPDDFYKALPASDLVSSMSPVAMSTISLASWFGSRGRLGLLVML